jgi:hypothetical protein
MTDPLDSRLVVLSDVKSERPPPPHAPSSSVIYALCVIVRIYVCVSNKQESGPFALPTNSLQCDSASLLIGHLLIRAGGTRALVTRSWFPASVTDVSNWRLCGNLSLLSLSLSCNIHEW